MINFAHQKILRSSTPLPDIRATLINRRTVSIDHFVIDKAIGELLGSYSLSNYTPEAIVQTPHHARKKNLYVISEDGSPTEIETPLVYSDHIAVIIPFPISNISSNPETKPQKGRKPPIIENPLSTLFCLAKVEEVPIPWLDDYVCGAIHTGPGVINGKWSVTAADVKTLLRQPKISVSSAAKLLFNHNHEPMDVRQIQRVVQAARVSLRGIALYVERNPEILVRLDIKIDFERFWPQKMTKRQHRGREEHPKRAETLRLLEQGAAVRTIERETGVSKNTIKKWKSELLAA